MLLWVINQTFYSIFFLCLVQIIRIIDEFDWEQIPLKIIFWLQWTITTFFSSFHFIWFHSFCIPFVSTCALRIPQFFSFMFENASIKIFVKWICIKYIQSSKYITYWSEFRMGRKERRNETDKTNSKWMILEGKKISNLEWYWMIYQHIN